MAPQYDLPQELVNLFRTFDLNADGNIDPNEFVELAQKMNLSLTEQNRMNAVCVKGGNYWR